MQLTAASSDQQIIDWLTALVAGVEDIYLRKPLTLAGRAEALGEGFGIDSFGKINLFYAIIDELGLTLPETDAEPWQTLADLIGFIQLHLPAD